MLDFTSALYLGFTHASRHRLDGGSLTLGKPAALVEPPGAQGLAGQLAGLIGCEAAVLAPSTLHVFWDLCTWLARQQFAFHADRGLYPIGRWGLERAASRGAQVGWFGHHDPDALARRLRFSRQRPVVVTDGFCPGCGLPAPLADYLEVARRHHGLLVVDDTQALGILGGRSDGAGLPLGSGGGGSLRFHAIEGEDIIMVNSLSKAFGAPLALLASSGRRVSAFAEHSATRVHCSPPSTAVVQAGLRALQLNRTSGDALRSHLASLIRDFRRLLRAQGRSATGGWFPVQTIDENGVAEVQQRLGRLGIHTVLQATTGRHAARLSFLLTARHTRPDIEHAARALSTVSPAVPGGKHGRLLISI